MDTSPKYIIAKIAAAILAIALVASLSVPKFGRIAERGNITKGISNCRQIITAMQIYASDNNGKYPDSDVPTAKSSNEAFLALFRADVLDNEMIFGCPISLGNPDGVIGDAPNFDQAVQSGENHWALTRGLNRKSPASIPCVFENPVNTDWPPKWNADIAEEPVKGRSWKGAKIIIGLADSSVTLLNLATKRGAAVPIATSQEPTARPVLFDALHSGSFLSPE